MEINELINKRHSVRRYKNSDISIETINELVERAIKAPSAGGLEAYAVFIVRGEGIKKLAEFARQDWISQASIVFVLCIDPEKSAKKYGDRGRKLYCIQDTTLFGAYLDLLWVEKGYGTCWVGAFNPQKVSNFLNIPEHLIPISFLVVGEKDE